MGNMGTVPHPPWVKSRWDRRSGFCGLLGWAFGPGIVVKTLPVIDQPRVDASPGVDRKGGEERDVPHPWQHRAPNVHGERSIEPAPLPLGGPAATCWHKSYSKSRRHATRICEFRM